MNTYVNSQGLEIALEGSTLVIRRGSDERRETWVNLADLLTRLAQLMGQ